MSRRSHLSPEDLTYLNVLYKSGLEVDIAKELHSSKVVFSYEQFSFEYRLKERLYWPDFQVVRDDGTILYIEVKGYLDRDSQRKMLAVKEAHPNETFVFLFYKDNPIRKGAKMRYSDWCKKHGFDYSIGTVPERWLKE